MFGDPKKVAALILAKRKELGLGRAPDLDDEEGLRAAAEDLMEALHGKDSGAAVSALKSFIAQSRSAPAEEGEAAE